MSGRSEKQSEARQPQLSRPKSRASLRTVTLLLAALAIPAAGGGAAADGGVVQVEAELRDGAHGMLALSLGASEVRAGIVEFTIINRSHVLPHGFLIVPQPAGGGTLPYDSDHELVEEKGLKGLQGLDTIAPGQTATLRVTLAPGEYVAFCNQPGHYDAGMFQHLTVR